MWRCRFHHVFCSIKLCLWRANVKNFAGFLHWFWGSASRALSVACLLSFSISNLSSFDGRPSRDVGCDISNRPPYAWKKGSITRQFLFCLNQYNNRLYLFYILRPLGGPVKVSAIGQIRKPRWIMNLLWLAIAIIIRKTNSGRCNIARFHYMNVDWLWLILYCKEASHETLSYRACSQFILSISRMAYSIEKGIDTLLYFLSFYYAFTFNLLHKWLSLTSFLIQCKATSQSRE